MPSELLIMLAVVAVLLWAVHSLSSVTVRVLRLSEEIEDEHHGFSARRRRLLHRLVENSRDLKLTTELATSLIYLIMVVVVGLMVNRWTPGLGWVRVPIVVVSLSLVWLLNTLVRGVLPKVKPPDETATVSSAGLAGIALVWRLSQPLRMMLHRFTGPRDRSRPTAEERGEIVERALDTLAHSAGLDEPVIEDDEREMIRGVIGLDATEVREVMVPRVRIVALDADASVEDVRRVTAEYGYSRFPLYEEDLDSIIGILYVKDLFTGLAPAGGLDLASVARDAFVVPETKKVDSLLEEFKRRKTHIAIVADEFGGTAGLVTLEDILEEIVGEIQDEHDPRGEAVEMAPDGSVFAEGVVPLIEIADRLGLSLPDEKFETVGGLVYDRVGGIPEIGQTVEEHGLSIRIEAMDGQRINRVRVTRIPPQASD